MPSIVRELTRLQEEHGWLSEEHLRELARRLNVPLHRLESVSTFYTHFRRSAPKGRVVEVCRDLSCCMAGATEAFSRLEAKLAGRDDVELVEVSCLGRCDTAPAANIGSGHDARTVTTANTDELLRTLDGETDQRSATSPTDWGEASLYDDDAQHYSTLRKALEGGDPIDLAHTLKESGLRGMGGAGFPTGLKWELVSKEKATPKYVICNADESEPGTFKDRQILADLPHLVLEGMALAALCVGAEKGWVFIRHEYEPERQRLEQAIEAARAAGALGRNLFGSEFCFDVEIFVSPGGYILGEETALLECMEDRRGEPRNKPPYPGSEGLYGKPTLMNNVETFAHATAILNRGLDWWRDLGRGEHAGHKFISVSGDVVRPGVVLIPFGATLGDLLDACGGMRDGKPLAAIMPGGASSNFLRADQLDVPIDFQTLADAGSMLGSGAAVFVAEGHDLLQLGLNVTRFFRNESCGKCVPCRVGSEKAVQLLEGRDSVPDETRDLLRELNQTLVRTSICGLGQVALGPLVSLLDRFSDSIDRE